MFADSLIPVPDADQIRIAHNEQAFERKSAQAFIRAKKLTSAFANLVDLRKSIEYNSLWTMEVIRHDSSAREVFAAPHFTAMLHASGTSIMDMDLLNAEISPALPRHDGLILAYVREVNGDRIWTMRWREGLGNYSYQLRSASLRSLFLCALQICAGKAEATLEAFDRYTIAH